MSMLIRKNPPRVRSRALDLDRHDGGVNFEGVRMARADLTWLNGAPRSAWWSGARGSLSQ